MFTTEIIQEIVWLHFIMKVSKYRLARNFYTNVQKIQEIIDEYGSISKKDWESTTTYMLRNSQQSAPKNKRKGTVRRQRRKDTKYRKND